MYLKRPSRRCPTCTAVCSLGEAEEGLWSIPKVRVVRQQMEVPDKDHFESLYLHRYWAVSRYMRSIDVFVELTRRATTEGGMNVAGSLHRVFSRCPPNGLNADRHVQWRSHPLQDRGQ